MKRILKSLINQTLSSHKLHFQSNPSLPINQFSILRLFSSTTSTTVSTHSNNNDNKKNKVTTKKSKKDSFILEKFRQRKLQGSSKPTTTTTTTQYRETTNGDSLDVISKKDGSFESLDQGNGPTKEVVSGFEELGLKEEVAMAAGELGIWVPSEIQCVGIPPILEGKCVVLSSHSGSGRTLSYLLALVQMLRQDEALSRMKPKHPKAIVLCNTEELSDEGFRIAKSISDFARLKSASDIGSDHLSTEDVFDAPIGMLIGTPSEVLQQIEEGNIATDNVKYLVLDAADTMLDNGFGPAISKITSPLSESKDRGLQTVLVTDTMTKILGKSNIMDRLEHDSAGKVAAMLLEIDQMEVLEIIRSSEALKKKMTEAIESFISDLEQ